jgi:hypothetical protein
MSKFLSLVTIIFTIALLAVATFSLPFLEQSGKLPLPAAWRQSLRRTVGYCVDGNQVYRQEERVPGSNSDAVCVCTPELGGVACASNRAEPNITD